MLAKPSEIVRNLDPYRAISCDYYDELEALATRRIICQITYLDQYRRKRFIESRIIDFKTIKGEEFILLKNDLEIRMDQIEKVNDLHPLDQKYC